MNVTNMQMSDKKRVLNLVFTFQASKDPHSEARRMGGSQMSYSLNS